MIVDAHANFKERDMRQTFLIALSAIAAAAIAVSASHVANAQAGLRAVSPAITQQSTQQAIEGVRRGMKQKSAKDEKDERPKEAKQATKIPPAVDKKLGKKPN